MHHMVTIDQNGRILIPADIRKKLDLTPNETLLIRVEDSGIYITNMDKVIEDVQAFVAARIPKDVSLVDELLETRKLDKNSEHGGKHNEN